eukprot:CAMPEP_0117674082 /NCGR_PEP_ID=MMETSP0804-20121206/14836_1 /TAXON_ID=1074897 /ORGANISM="Tetraselmis astigmatica, Strain CCMP880" /LENGTH=228 /DNA_ID=CAMNT_0005482903 /DNA_START=63 /DNA_END=749 /DNA_ORIENTATION=-
MSGEDTSPLEPSTVASVQLAGADSHPTEQQQASPKSPLPDTTIATAEHVSEEEELELDEETLELLRDMQQQEDELEAILARHSEDAEELTRIRDAMASELALLKQEAWKLQAMQDLESMRGQLDALLEGPTETAEDAAERAQSQADVKEQVGALLEMEEAALDTELDELRAQLADIKLQASEMDERRATLVEELANVQFPERWDAEEMAGAKASGAIDSVDLAGSQAE